MIDLVNAVLLPIGLGLLGFVEPCSIGSSLVLIKYLEGRDAASKIAQTVLFAASRAASIGALGALAALLGTAFMGFQRGARILLGLLYVAIGAVYLLGKAGILMRAVGPRLLRLSGSRGSACLGLLFGLDIPACAAPLIFALFGAAAAGGSLRGTVVHGFITLALFGLALSLPLVLAVVSPAARRELERLSTFSARAPMVIAILLMGLGLWSIYFGLFVTPKPSPTWVS